MAIGTINRLPEGVGAEQYDAVDGAIDMAGIPVEGLIFHSAGQLEGRFQIFNVWESREHYDSFVADRLRPAMVAVMGEERVAELPDAETVEAPIHNYLIP
jgi:hypothetical protein